MSELINPARIVPGKLVPARIVENKKVEKTNEEKLYIVLYIEIVDDEYIKKFEECIGRTATYEFIKSIAEYIDIHESKILLEGVNILEAATVYEFMIYVKNMYKDDEFNIEDYNEMVDDDNEPVVIDPSTINMEAYNLYTNIGDFEYEESEDNDDNNEI